MFSCGRGEGRRCGMGHEEGVTRVARCDGGVGGGMRGNMWWEGMVGV